MQNTVVKYSMITFLLLTYINRGVFITPYETENHGNIEINSAIEWVTQLITGESNDIDEDGDLQTDCNFIKIVQLDFLQQMGKYLELISLSFQNIEIRTFPKKEDFLINDFCAKIDHPPQVI